MYPNAVSLWKIKHINVMTMCFLIFKCFYYNINALRLLLPSPGVVLVGQFSCCIEAAWRRRSVSQWTVGKTCMHTNCSSKAGFFSYVIIAFKHQLPLYCEMEFGSLQMLLKHDQMKKCIALDSQHRFVMTGVVLVLVHLTVECCSYQCWFNCIIPSLSTDLSP